MKLWQKVVLALVLGVIVGFFMNADGPFGYDGSALLTTYIKPIGTIFINLIKMVVVPLIFFSLILGITSMTNAEAFKRIGMKSVLAYLFTATFAVIIGLGFGLLFKPGTHIDLAALLHSAAAASAPKIDAPKEKFDVIKMFVDMVPTNALEAMVQDHVLQVVVFSIFLGITINRLGKKAKIVRDFCHESAHVVFEMIQIIMSFAPYGVFAFTSWVVSTLGLPALISFAVLVITVFSALFTQYLLFGVMILVFGRISPLPFYKKMTEVQSLAFSTSSSKAALPTAMRVVNERIGVSESTTSFVLPLGTSINMDGTAIYLGICALFFQQAYHLPDFTAHQYFVLILTATLGSIGAAGIPGGSFAVMGMVFTSVGLPLEGIGVIMGIDRILDMLRTTVNITGDSVITMLVDKSEGTFDKKKYNNPDL